MYLNVGEFLNFGIRRGTIKSPDAGQVAQREEHVKRKFVKNTGSTPTWLYYIFYKNSYLSDTSLEQDL